MLCLKVIFDFFSNIVIRYWFKRKTFTIIIFHSLNFPTTRINGFIYILPETIVRSFPSCSCSEYFRKYRWKSPYVSNDRLWKLFLYLDFLAEFLFDIYEIFNINSCSNLDYKKWFKQGISLDDSNFDMENYSSLVDVKLLLKRILDSY